MQSGAVPRDAAFARPAVGAGGPATPAAAAARRVFGASLVLGLLALAAAAVAVTRLFASWTVTSRPASHVISVLGQRLSYPAANVGAIIVVLLAGIGVAMVGAVVRTLARELIADRRFRRALRVFPARRLGGAWVIDDDRPQAFCAGLLHSRVYVSSGALALLDGPALAAVLAHERHHARNRDPLRLACGRALAAGLLIVPTMRRLVERQRALAEIGADEAALQARDVDRSALAEAMLSLAQTTGAGAVGIDPERVDHLLGERTSWGFPLLLCVASAAALALLSALAVLAARVGAGSATLAPPFLSGQPCIAVLAMFPLGALLASLAYARARRAGRAPADA